MSRLDQIQKLIEEEYKDFPEKLQIKIILNFYYMLDRNRNLIDMYNLGYKARRIEEGKTNGKSESG